MSRERVSLSLSNIIGIVLVGLVLGASIVGVYVRLAIVETEVKEMKRQVTKLYEHFFPTSVAERSR